MLKNVDFKNEIIVVNDGSTDSSGKILKEIDDISVLQHDYNLGYGAAIKTGIHHSQFEYIVITDADGTYPNERIPDLVTTLIDNNCDMVVCARTGKVVKIPYRGKIESTILDLLGGIRSTCTYIGAKRITELSKRATFIRTRHQLNNIFN